MKFLEIVGSLRSGSFHKALAKAAINLVPADVEMEMFEGLQDIPPFNQDMESKMPEAIIAFKNKIMAADAIVIVTPEYNYSIPGVLKNAIDWASRPYGQSAWKEKPVALMSGSVGNVGGSRAQYHLRQTFVFLEMYPLNQPEVIIPQIGEKFDNKGNLIDAHTRDKVKEQLEALAVWTKKLKGEIGVTRKTPPEKHPYEQA